MQTTIEKLNIKVWTRANSTFRFCTSCFYLDTAITKSAFRKMGMLSMQCLIYGFLIHIGCPARNECKCDCGVSRPWCQGIRRVKPAILTCVCQFILLPNLFCFHQYPFFSLTAFSPSNANRILCFGRHQSQHQHYKLCSTSLQLWEWIWEHRW